MRDDSITFYPKNGHYNKPMKFKWMSRFILSVGAVFIVGCASFKSKGQQGKRNGGPVYYALAVMNPTQGQKAKGQIWIAEGFGKVKVEVNMTGLDPNSQHGIHIFEFGDCSAPDAVSVGEHYNPEGKPHGGLKGPARHLGDLGNLNTDKKGEAHLSFVVENMSINTNLNPVLGRALVIDKNPDDLTSQPSGGLSPRVSCGVIGAATR